MLAEPRYRWSELSQKGPEAHAVASLEARELARILAAQSLVEDPEAVLEELDARLSAFLSDLWGDGPVTGYGLHSSLGAYLVAKIAVGLVPAGGAALRHEPLRRRGLQSFLVENGLAPSAAEALLGQWQAVGADFTPQPKGLDASMLAGLAERTLTRAEHAQALAQVAYSPRCLARLSATCNLLTDVRSLMPLLPGEANGRDWALAVAALALGRGERALAFLHGRPEGLKNRTLSELAAAQVALAEGRVPELDDVGRWLMPDLEATETEVATESKVPSDEFVEERGTEVLTRDEDDVLEIVEERVDPESGVAAPTAVQVAGGRPVEWGDARPSGPVDLAAWRESAALLAGLVAQRGSLLGLQPLPARPSAPRAPAPPDLALVEALHGLAPEPSEHTERIPVGQIMARLRPEGPLDPLFTPVRGALRAILAAVDGRAPTLAAIEAAGDLGTILRRARALARAIQGDLPGAAAAVEGLPEAAVPEARWIRDRRVRFEGRSAEPVSPQDACALASAQVRDLFEQLARTAAGHGFVG